MVCGKPLYFFKITVVPLHFHCLSAVCICSAAVAAVEEIQCTITELLQSLRWQKEREWWRSSSPIHSSLVQYSTQLIFGKKTIPTTFIPFSIWYGYLCSPHKILGCIYESSREHVFHKGSPFRFISISFIQRGDPYEKQVLWKIHKHPLIFCMVDISNHSNLKMQ